MHDDNFRTLVIGKIPDDFSANSHILLSPHCFLHNEEKFLQWGKIAFEKDPADTPEKLYEADKITTDYAWKILKNSVNTLNRKSGNNCTARYWRVMALPWLIFFVQTAWERQCRILNFLKQHRETPFQVTLIKDTIDWNFKDTLDFYENGVMGPDYNEWLFSRILEGVVPKTWKVEWTDKSIAAGHAGAKNRSDKSGNVSTSNGYHQQHIRLLIKNIYDSAFKKASVYKIQDVNLAVTLILNFMLLLKSSKNSVRRIGCEKKLDAISDSDINLPWCFDFEKTMWKVIPSSIISSRHNPKVSQKKSNGLFVSSTDIWYDDWVRKPVLASASEKKARIVSTQHGGHNYGTAKSFHVAQATEYANEYFITYGWTHQGNYQGNFLDLPSPLLSKNAEKHTPKNSRLILVGTMVRLFMHRFQSTPMPVQFLNYLNMKKDFLSLIDKNIFRNLYYKKYPPGSGALDDMVFLKSTFPELKDFTGNLHQQMLQCKLLILDHPGTTLNVAMAANTPMIGFWDKAHWSVCRQAAPYFEALEAAGVLFETGSGAAEKVNDICHNVQRWWEQPAVQKARKEWCCKYARTSKIWWLKWAKKMWNL